MSGFEGLWYLGLLSVSGVRRALRFGVRVSAPLGKELMAKLLCMLYRAWGPFMHWTSIREE